MSNLILANIIGEKLRTHPDLDVLTFVTIDKDGGYQEELRTYRQLWDNGRRIAAALQSVSLVQGQSFGLMMLNHPEFVDAMVGASFTNTILVPVDARTQGAKLAYMLDNAECRGIIVADYALSQLVEIRNELEGLEWIWVMDSGQGIELPADDRRVQWLHEILSDDVSSVEIATKDPLDPMQMLYTSGTTGDPTAILANHGRFGIAADNGPLFGITVDDRPYTGLSLTHANAQFFTLATALKLGLRAVFSRKFTKSRLWDICRHYNCTTFTLLGGMTTALFAEPEKDNDGNNPVRQVLSAGMPPAIWHEFKQRFNVEIFEAYGTAEGGMTVNPPGAGPAGSVGNALPNYICKVLDENNRELAAGVSGEICFQNADGSDFYVSYYKDPEASKAKIRGGWYRTGDIGHTDENGWLYFDYRDGNGIRRNGDFINAAFVEKAISSSIDVSDVYVYGISTEANAPGEKEVVAAVVPAQPDFDGAALFKHCRESLEANFVPSFIQIVQEIPKTASEKPQERFLVEDLNRGGDNILKRI